ncbi:hypothetical protein ACMUMQ_13355 [Marinomonas sp. 2405UD66-6]|uniref:hypothetical protein n=1 Tax=Marinomonas sp. 2405UD66-6 TaxID=3391834 RepID=UPI0039C95391
MLGRLKACIYGVVLFMSGCDYIPHSAEWALDKQETEQWMSTAEDFSTAIDRAFQTHQVVMLGDYHWNEKVISDYVRLLEQPGFLDEVKHLVVEFGNSRYQKSLDDYLNGHSDDASILDRVRRDALFFTAWMPDIYVDFFMAVRRYNLSVADYQRVRVWLAEAPFYWEEVSEASDWKSAADNKTAGFLNVAHDAMELNEKVLMVFGAFHLLDVSNAPEGVSLPLGTLLKHAYPEQIFTVWPITESIPNAALSSLKEPSLLLTSQPEAKKLSFLDVLPKAKVRLGAYGYQDSSVDELIDGLLYIGESELSTKLPNSVMQDEEWLKEMEARLTIIGGRPLSAFKEMLSNSQP